MPWRRTAGRAKVNAGEKNEEILAGVWHSTVLCGPPTAGS